MWNELNFTHKLNSASGEAKWEKFCRLAYGLWKKLNSFYFSYKCLLKFMQRKLCWILVPLYQQYDNGGIVCY